MLVGRSDCSIIKNPHFGPPPIFQNIFFGPRPSLQKITNANTNTKVIFWRQTKTEKMTCIFFIERWLQIWHLADSLLTPCWHLADNCTSVTTWHSFDKCLTNVFMQSGFSPGAVTKYFLMFTAIIEQSISTLILLKKVWELEFNLNKPFSHNWW